MLSKFKQATVFSIAIAEWLSNPSRRVRFLQTMRTRKYTSARRLWQCFHFTGHQQGPTQDVTILGGGESALDDYYIAAAAAQGRGVVFDDDNSDGWFFRSDNYNFVKKGMRAITVVNDVKPEWYQKPSDEYRDSWNLSGTLANTNMMLAWASHSHTLRKRISILYLHLLDLSDVYRVEVVLGVVRIDGVLMDGPALLKFRLIEFFANQYQASSK